jgi:succinate dehydrogenase / fumarate reductase iron-sulfur subunit
MIQKMDELGFGNCGNHKECEAVCPKEISISNIARFNREFLKASFVSAKKMGEETKAGEEE